MAKPIVKIDESVGTQTTPEKTFVPTPEAKKKATTDRIIAVVLWALALGCEATAIFYVLMQKPANFIVWLIVCIVADLALVIVGSMIWKKANRLDPASKKDKTRFFIQNQLGAIISIIAFLPLVILIFTDKDLSGKQKGIVGAIAIVALIGAGLLSADFNPPSVEQYTDQINQVETLTGQNHVYWTKSGTHYHLYADCYTINRDATTEIYEGTVQQARELKNITDLCSICENRALAEKAANEAQVGETEEAEELNQGDADQAA